MPSVKLRFEWADRTVLVGLGNRLRPGPSEDCGLRKGLGLCRSNPPSFEVVFLKFLLRPLLIEEAMLADEVNRLCSMMGKAMPAASSVGLRLCCDLLKLNRFGEFAPRESDEVDTDGLRK
jgi:hypothetical protein